MFLIQQRRQEGIKVSDFDVGVPLTLMGGQTRGKSGEGRSLLPLTTTCKCCDCHVTYTDPLVHEEGELRMKFKVVMRKGHNKQQVKSCD